MNNKLMILTVAMLGASAAASAQPLDFKGIVLGAVTTTEQVEAAMNKTDCNVEENHCRITNEYRETRPVKCGNGTKGKLVCNGKTTMAGYVGDLNLVLSADMRVIRMNFSYTKSAFLLVKNALASKFGAPDKSKLAHKEASYEWNGGEGMRLIASHSWRYKNALVQFNTDEDNKARASITGDTSDL